MRKLATILILLFGVVLFAQETAAQKELLKRANENVELLNTDTERAFQQAKEIEKEAQRKNAKEEELQAIKTQCDYYTTKLDFKNTLLTAELLLQKAELYKIPIYQIIAKNYLFEAYAFSDLPDKGFQELKDGMNLMNQLDPNNASNILGKGNLYISYANYYFLKNDRKNQLKYIKLSGKQFEKIPNKKQKEYLLYFYYSNLASIYFEIKEEDSAKYYAELSISKNKEFNDDNVMFLNLSTLGNIAMKNSNYKQGLSYFKKAEKLKDYRNHLNIESLYDNIIESYQGLEKKDSVELYKTKKDSLKLVIAENQNDSLHKLLEDKGNKISEKYIYISLGIFTIMLLIVFLLIRKNLILANQERASQKYLEQIPEIKDSDLSGLLKMFKTNDLAFMPKFDETFPDFTQKLLAINPKIVQSEIEFCAFLKLKIPTKDIVRYRNIAHRTVQNKKYLIRKKLNVPKGVDIYNWFDSA